MFGQKFGRKKSATGVAVSSAPYWASSHEVVRQVKWCRTGRIPPWPGEAGVLGAGVGGVVRTLAFEAADRVDRGEVDHVEAEPGDPLQLLTDVGQGPVSAVCPERTWEQLVPGAELGPFPIDVEGIGPFGTGLRIGPARRPHGVVDEGVVDDGRQIAVGQAGRRLVESLPGGGVGRLGLSQQGSSNLQVDGLEDPGFGLCRRPLAPTGPGVDPADDAEVPVVVMFVLLCRRARPGQLAWPGRGGPGGPSARRTRARPPVWSRPGAGYR